MLTLYRSRACESMFMLTGHKHVEACCCLVVQSMGEHVSIVICDLSWYTCTLLD